VTDSEDNDMQRAAAEWTTPQQRYFNCSRRNSSTLRTWCGPGHDRHVAPATTIKTSKYCCCDNGVPLKTCQQCRWRTSKRAVGDL